MTMWLKELSSLFTNYKQTGGDTTSLKSATSQVAPSNSSLQSVVTGKFLEHTLSISSSSTLSESQSLSSLLVDRLGVVADVDIADISISSKLYKEVFSKGQLCKIRDQKGAYLLEFRYSVPVYRNGCCFENQETAYFNTKKEFEEFLRKNSYQVNSWEIEDNYNFKPTYSYIRSDLIGNLENYSSLSAMHCAILKEKRSEKKIFDGTAFYVYDVTTQQNSFVLYQHGFFGDSCKQFSDEQEFLKALDLVLNRYASVNKGLVALGVASLTAAAAAAIYFATRSVNDLTVVQVEELEDVSNGQSQLTTVLATSAAVATRHLLSFAVKAISPQGLQPFPQKLVTSEEDSVSLDCYTWGPFYSLGNTITVSAQQSDGRILPSGLAVSNHPMNVMGSLSIPSGKGVVYSGEYAYVGTSTGLRVVDVSDPLSPTLVSFINMRGGLESLKIVENIGYAITAGFPGLYLTTLDLTDPLNPLLLGSVLTGLSQSYALEVKGDNCYISGSVVGPISASLAIVNSNNSTNLIKVGSINIPSISSFLSVKANEDLLYVGGSKGVYLYNISNPATQIPLSSLSSIGSANSLAFANDIVYAGTTNGLQMITTNTVGNSTTMALAGTFASGQAITNVKIADGYCYVVNQGFLLQKLDITNPLAPVVCGQMLINPVDMDISPENMFLLDSTGLKVSNLGPTFSLTGTPAGGTQGNYSIDFIGKSAGGAVIKQTMNLEIQPAVVQKESIGQQKALVGQPFTLFVGTFFAQVNGNFLTYSIKQGNGQAAPSWLVLNPLSGVISGIATGEDVGLLDLQVTATDALGASSTSTFQMNVLNGPTVSAAVTKQPSIVGVPFSYTIPSDLFVDKDGLPLDVTISVSGGDWLTVNQETGVLTGVPSTIDVGAVVVTVTAKDPFDTTTVTSFNIDVVPDAPPQQQILIENQQATTRAPFTYKLPSDTFIDPNGGPVTYSATFGDGSSLDGSWISFDPKTLEFTGTPTYADSNFYQLKDFQIQVTAKGRKLSSAVNFTVAVGGWSWGQFALTVGLPLASATATGIGAYYKRVQLWNRLTQSKRTNWLFKNTYTKPPRREVEGDSFSYTSSVPTRQLEYVRFLSEGQKLHGRLMLPDGFRMNYAEGILSSSSLPRAQNDADSYTVLFYDRIGYIREQFELHIERNPHLKGEVVQQPASDALMQEILKRVVAELARNNNRLDSPSSMSVSQLQTQVKLASEVSPRGDPLRNQEIELQEVGLRNGHRVSGFSRQLRPLATLPGVLNGAELSSPSVVGSPSGAQSPLRASEFRVPRNSMIARLSPDGLLQASPLAVYAEQGNNSG